MPKIEDDPSKQNTSQEYICTKWLTWYVYMYRHICIYRYIFQEKYLWFTGFFFKTFAKSEKCGGASKIRDVGRNVRTKKLSSCDNNRMPDGLTSALMGGDCGRSVRFLSEFCKNKNKTDSEFQVFFGEVCFCLVVRNTFIGEWWWYWLS